MTDKASTAVNPTTSADELTASMAEAMTPPVIDSSAGRWYVVHTYSGHENKVAANLKQRIETQKLTHKIFDIVVPTRNIVKVSHGKKKKSKKNFPGIYFGKNDFGR